MLSLRQADVSPLSSKPFVEVTIPLYYEGHAYRRGSRIRVTITAPNGDQPIWSFADQPPAFREVSMAFALDALEPDPPGGPRVAVPTGLPPCPGLRGEPCRSYVPLP